MYQSPKKANGQDFKGNVLIEKASNTGKYTSLWSSNPRGDFLELDLSSLKDNSVAPLGAITMIYGQSKIPPFWRICDGSNGTVNLVDYFVQGTDKESEVGNVSGSHNIKLITHTHTVTIGSVGNHSHHANPPAARTSGVGNHTHPYEKELINNRSVDGHYGPPNDCCPSFNSGRGPSMRSTGVWKSSTVDAHGNHRHKANPPGFNCSDAGGHYHTITVHKAGKTGNASGKDGNKPPYYTLIYIQKVKTR